MSNYESHINTSKGITLGGLGSTTIGALTLGDLLAIVGFFITLAGFGFNIYYSRKQDQRKQRELEILEESHKNSMLEKNSPVQNDQD
jgi:4-hydroxybenzoate polyprenyltransferase